MSAEFDALYAAKAGRPSTPPEMLLRAMLLQAFYTIRSERQLMERLEFDLLFRWFVGLSADEQAWDHSTFTKNRDRLLEGEIAARFLGAVLAQKRVIRLLSTRHFSADGTLIAAWASLKSFKEHGGGDGDPPGGGGSGRNADVDFKGAKRSNATHRSTTDPEAMLYRKGPGDGGETLLHWPCADGEPLGIVRRRAADAGLRPCRAACRLEMIEARAGPGSRPVGVTLGADKGYDEAGFVAGLREVGVTPHVAQKARYSAIDGRTTRHESYRTSQRIRKRIEEGFGWLKTIGGLHKSRFVGRDKTDWAFTFAVAAYNLVRLPKLFAETA
jgi:transposase